jgi:hypothetical protein
LPQHFEIPVIRVKQWLFLAINHFLKSLHESGAKRFKVEGERRGKHALVWVVEEVRTAPA